MTVKELQEKLSGLHPDTQVMILDGFNGGGTLREINLGPVFRVVSPADAKETADCEELVGKCVAALGFGYY